MVHLTPEWKYKEESHSLLAERLTQDQVRLDIFLRIQHDILDKLYFVTELSRENTLGFSIPNLERIFINCSVWRKY